MIRNVLAVLAGAVAGSVVNMAIVLLSLVLFPLPEGVNMNNPVSMQSYIETLPWTAFVLVWKAHAGGTLAGGVVAAWIAGSRKLLCAMVVGLFFLVGGAINLYQLQHPVAFAVIDLLSYLPAAYLGGGIMTRTRKPAKSEAEPTA